MSGKKRNRKSGKKSKSKVKRHKAFDATVFYAKYPWVVEGSVKEVPVGTKVDSITVAHGRVCSIKCQETGVLRTINVQDAFQTKYCEEVQARKAREKAAERRKNKKSKKG